MIDSKVTPISSGVKRGWRLFVTNTEGERQVIDDVSLAELENPKFGVWRYGKSPSGPYDQWSFHEVNGGGSVIVPYCIRLGVLLVGLVQQNREFQSSEPVWNVPRGFAEAGESYFETGLREMGEEVGVGNDTSYSRIIELPGKVNPQNTFFETWPAGEGVSFLGYRFLVEELEPIADGRFQLDRELKPKPGIGETFYKSEFWPWKKTMALSDMFTRAAVGSLVAAILP